MHAVLIGMTLLAGEIDFARDIRPILSDKCFQCHGPDTAERQAGLRLDIRDSAVSKLESDKFAIVPGKPEQSELLSRIISTDPDLQMPPKSSHKKLSREDIAKLRQWIEAGAEYQQHWAFVAPKRPAVPAINEANPIDQFILARLQKENLRLSPTAEKHTLLRRVTLDLTGLPPTTSELDAFLRDESTDAYEKVVERLLASPRYGERMALDWMDAARYADTHGYHIDSGRDMTRWRDWVINAFHQNMPFDQFTIEQFAGDLLPNATLDQKIATGFHRNHMINFEGGAIPQEYHTAYIVDRVNTMGAVWLGLTVGCAQCHEHKFDPISQEEYYGLFAFFNSVPEKGLDGNKGNAEPTVPAPSEEQQARLAEIRKQLASVVEEINAPSKEIDAEQVAWESKVGASKAPTWQPIKPASANSAKGSRMRIAPDGKVIADGPNPPTENYSINWTPAAGKWTGLRVEFLPNSKLNGKGPGRSNNGNFVMTEIRTSFDTKVQKTKSAIADFSQADFPPAYAFDGKNETGWAIFPRVGERREFIIEWEHPIATDGKQAIDFTMEFQSRFPQHQPAEFRLSLTSSPNPTVVDSLPAAIRTLVQKKAENRTSAEAAKLRSYFRDHISNKLADVRKRRVELAARERQLVAAIPTAMVMAEMKNPRDTFVLMRGEYDQRGAKVKPTTPAFLPPLKLAKGEQPNRLTLAKWLVSPENPLTARVTVNRYWQLLFGTGLVKTAEDFGSQGDLPSHPELLDFLATEFVRSGWDVKSLVRMIVTSQTYRQSSLVSPQQLASDPENRLLARSPRFRLQAEFLRDLALATSALLDNRIGGASVSPYQPPGLWEELMSREDGANWSAQTYTQSHGRDLYRRGMYTFWKRTSPHPVMTTFDAPDRELCTVRRARTNTPLQALALMNETAFVECSRKLAERMIRSADQPAKRLAFGFRTVLSRNPNERETRVLLDLINQQLTDFRAEPAKAKKLMAVGESPADPKLDPIEVAAWTIVANTLLNLDEAVTRN